MSSSLGGSLSLADFDCYEPRKWKSNVYNRERLDVKQKLLGLARQVGGSVLGADGSPLYIEASVEHPALWNHKQVDSQSVYFSRHEAARKELDGFIDRSKPMASLIDDPTPQRNHVFLAITVSHEVLEISLRLHSDARVDRQNLERKLDDYYEAERLVGLLAGLSHGYRLGITPDLTAIAELGEGHLTLEALHEVIGKLPPGGALPMPGQLPHLFYIGIALPRGEAVALSGDEISEWTQARLAELASIYRFLAWSRDNDFVSMRQVLDKEKTVKRQRGLQKGDRVRVVRGLLAGKDGLVQEVDAKGHLKVLVGKMVVKIDAADVDRPES